MLSLTKGTYGISIENRKGLQPYIYFVKPRASALSFFTDRPFRASLLNYFKKECFEWPQPINKTNSFCLKGKNIKNIGCQP